MTLDLAALYAMHAAALVAYFGRRLGDTELAADLAHETFARACAAAPRYESRGYQPRAWLYRIAHNLLVDHRRRRRLPCCPLDERAQALPADEGDDPEGAVADAALWAAVDGLLPKQRAVVLCWVRDGLTARETGARLGMSEGSVKKLRARALGSLRRRLGLGVTA